MRIRAQKIRGQGEVQKRGSSDKIAFQENLLILGEIDANNVYYRGYRRK